MIRVTAEIRRRSAKAGNIRIKAMREPSAEVRMELHVAGVSFVVYLDHAEAYTLAADVNSACAVLRGNKLERNDGKN